MIATNTSSIPIARARGRAAETESLPRRSLVRPPIARTVRRSHPDGFDRRAGRRVRGRVPHPARQVACRRRGRAGVRSQPDPVRDVQRGGRIVADGYIAGPEQVDEVVRSSFGFRLPFFGPFTIADMAGLDVYADIYETLERRLGPGLLRPRGTAGARRSWRVRGQDRPRVPGAVAGADGRADRPEEPRVRRARGNEGGHRVVTDVAAPMLPTQRLDGRHAIVTGAGRGIGRAAALALRRGGRGRSPFGPVGASSRQSRTRCGRVADLPRSASGTCAR